MWSLNFKVAFLMPTSLKSTFAPLLRFLTTAFDFLAISHAFLTPSPSRFRVVRSTGAPHAVPKNKNSRVFMPTSSKLTFGTVMGFLLAVLNSSAASHSFMTFSLSLFRVFRSKKYPHAVQQIQSRGCFRSTSRKI